MGVTVSKLLPSRRAFVRPSFAPGRMCLQSRGFMILILVELKQLKQEYPILLFV
jgi:hypothetical protein